MKRTLRHWVRFALALVLLASVVGCLHVVGSRLPGIPGALIAQNKAQGREVYAYFYSDLGNIRSFLDDARGAYGAVTLRRVLEHAPSTLSAETRYSHPRRVW